MITLEAKRPERQAEHLVHVGRSFTLCGDVPPLSHVPS